MSPELTSKISNVENLCIDYQRLQYNDSDPLATINAFHDWYDAASVLFSDYFENDDNYKKFIEVETGGNSYVLSHVFNSIRSPYNILINKLKIGEVKSSDGQNSSTKNEPYIFISHASADNELLQLFKTHILKTGLGFKDDQIGYTSDEASGVGAGENIPEYIKKGIKRAQVVLCMISDDYRASEVCLNEMGAAWALEKYPISVLLPGVSFKKLGWLNTFDKAIKIEDSEMLGNLQEVICKKSNIPTPRIPSWNQCVKNFLAAIENIKRNAQEKIEKDKSPYLTFKDGAIEKQIELPFVVTTYIHKPTPKIPSSPNALSFGSSSLDYAMATLARPQLEISQTSVLGETKINLSMAQIHLEFHNPGDCLENVSVTITANNIRFDNDNKSGGILIHSKNKHFSCKDECCHYDLETYNAGVMSQLYGFYVEPTDFCGEFDGYADENIHEYKLNYTISTKHRPYIGELTLIIKPKYDYTDSEINDEKADKCLVKCKMEDVNNKNTRNKKMPFGR